jgi:hypothetical protein
MRTARCDRRCDRVAGVGDSGITLGYQNRKIMPPASTRALADLGLQHYAKSNYVEAVQLFEEVYEGSGGSQQAELLLPMHCWPAET